MDRILRWLFRSGARRAFGGGHPSWLLLALATALLRRLRRREKPVVLSSRMKIGDRLMVTLSDPTQSKTAPKA